MLCRDCHLNVQLCSDLYLNDNYPVRKVSTVFIVLDRWKLVFVSENKTKQARHYRYTLVTLLAVFRQNELIPSTILYAMHDLAVPTLLPCKHLIVRLVPFPQGFSLALMSDN